MLQPIDAKYITTFDYSTTYALIQMLQEQHIRLAQLDSPTAQRSLTARNYGSGLNGLQDYLNQTGQSLPTKSALEDWRQSMLDDGKSVSTVNMRLAAVRKLLRGVADDVTDITVKTVLRDWATVADAKAVQKQDTIETDYGKRFTLASVKALLGSIDIRHLKGMRDRALIAVMLGAGLRVSEVAKLTLRDVFLTTNENGQKGIHIRDSKHHKSRVVVLDGWNSWVFKAVKAYTDLLDISADREPDAVIFRGVKIVKRNFKHQGTVYSSVGEKISVRNIETAIGEYSAEYAGQPVQIACHDLRRTYAKLCKQSGMSWEALRANMGHSSVTITEAYVGHDVDWMERIPNWKIDI